MKIYIALIVIAIVMLAACAKPPEDVASAQINEVSGGSEDSMEEEQEAMVEEESDSMMEEESMDGGTSIDKSKSTFTFEGYGPGKSHDGTFDDWTGMVYSDETGITGIEGTIMTASVNTGIGGLDSHLKKDDFFDVEVYPEIMFKSSSISEGQMTGELTFRGVTKEITFPVTVTETSVSTDFLLDSTPFGMTNTKVDKQVRIAFEFSI